MSNARNAVGAVLGTVSETAATVTNVVQTLSAAVSMGNSFVASAAADQKDRQKLHRAVFREDLLREHRMQRAVSDLAVVEFCKQSEATADLYKSATERFPDNFFDD